jgi:hypothetical protein
MGPGSRPGQRKFFIADSIFTAVIVRLDRTIQYAAASRFILRRSGILVRPIKSGDDE